MARLLFQATGFTLLTLATLSGCAATARHGQVVHLGSEGEATPEPKTSFGSAPGTETYAYSHGKGPSLEVPTTAEEAAIFHFSLGQAYSLDNDPQRAIESYRATLVHDPKSALVRARLAAELVKVGNFSEAKTLCEEAIKIDGKYVDSYLLLAGIQVAAKEYDAATATYRSALTHDPKNRDALLYLGVTLAEVGKTKEGVAELEKLVKLRDNPESNIDQSVAYYYLGKVYDQGNQKDKAVKAYSVAIEKRPGFAKAALAVAEIYSARKQNEKAFAVLEDVFAESRSPEIAEKLAERHLELNDYKGAVVYLETLTEEDPSNENMKLRLALVYWQVKWFDKAEATLADLHAHYPASSEISYYLGELRLERGDFDGALSYYTQVGPDYVKYDQMVSRVAFAYRQQNKLNAAEIFLLDSMKKRPDVVAFYPLLAAVYEDQKKFEDSRVVLERGEKLFPTDENVLYYLGFTLDRLGKKDQALTKMEKLLTVNPNNPNALNFVGYTLLDRGTDLAQAQTYLERAVSLKPDDAFILDSYGWLLYRTGKRREAMKQLEKAYASKPEEGVIAEHLADIYVSLNMPQKALAVYAAALKSSASDQELMARVQNKMANVRGVVAEKDTPSTISQAPVGRAEVLERYRDGADESRIPASK
jgi:tetratricopeptide (TPR) repeat protein